MEARLVYKVNGINVPLERMEFEELDEFTYEEFDNEQEIINSPRYKSKIGHLPKDGEVRVVYEAEDIPVRELDNYTELGGNPFEGEQSISPLVGDRKIGPSIRSVRENIIRTISSVEVAEEFYQVFGEHYTLRERFLHVIGMMSESNQDVFEGIRHVVGDFTSGYGGYFMGRVFLEKLGTFDSVENKDEKGRIYSPRLMKKK